MPVLLRGGEKPALKPKPRLSAQQLDHIRERRKSLVSGGQENNNGLSLAVPNSGEDVADVDEVKLRRRRKEEGRVTSTRATTWRASMGAWHENVVRSASVALSVGFMNMLGYVKEKKDTTCQFLGGKGRREGKARVTGRGRPTAGLIFLASLTVTSS